MNCLIVGFGSAGRRHQRVLHELGHGTVVVSRRPCVGDVQSIAEGINAAKPSYVVVATETGDHQRALMELATSGYRDTVLVEKPLGFLDAATVEPFERTVVGYNLRFHPCVAALRDHLGAQLAVSVQARVGQRIDEWRPGRNARTTASNAVGGGALRDLSHELDLLDWLFGPCRDVAALGGHVESLGLEVDGSWSCLLRHQRCPQVSLEMNYLDSPASRFMHIVTGRQTYVCDLVASRLTIDGDLIVNDPQGMDRSYELMHGAILAGEDGVGCSIEEGLRTMRVIHSIERAAADRTWVSVD